jgi:hypothetical protein
MRVFFMDWCPVPLGMLAGTLHSDKEVTPEVLFTSAEEIDVDGERILPVSEVRFARRADGIFLFAVRFHESVSCLEHLAIGRLIGDRLKTRCFGHVHIFHKDTRDENATKPMPLKIQRLQKTGAPAFGAIMIEDLGSEKFLSHILKNGEDADAKSISPAFSSLSTARGTEFLRKIAEHNGAVALIRRVNARDENRTPIEIPALRMLASRLARTRDRSLVMAATIEEVVEDDRIIHSFRSGMLAIATSCLVVTGLALPVGMSSGPILAVFVILFAFIAYMAFNILRDHEGDHVSAMNTLRLLNKAKGFLTMTRPLGQVVHLLYADKTPPAIIKSPYAELVSSPYDAAVEAVEVKRAELEADIQWRLDRKMLNVTRAGVIAAIAIFVVSAVSQDYKSAKAGSSTTVEQPVNGVN